MKLGDKLYYPGHGISRVIKLEDRGRLGTFVIIQVESHDLTIMIPIAEINELTRPLIPIKDLGKFRIPEIKHDRNMTWNRRYREIMETIKDGNPNEMLKALGTLMALKAEKELSFGERKMLDILQDWYQAEITDRSEVK